MLEVERGVYEVVIWCLGVRPDRVAALNDDTDLERDLGGNVLDIAETLTELEERFGVMPRGALFGEGAAGPWTIGRLTDMVCRKLGVERPPRPVLPGEESLRKFRPGGAPTGDIHNPPDDRLAENPDEPPPRPGRGDITPAG